MQAEHTIVTEFQSSVDFAVKRFWITKNQAELIRLAGVIEEISYQILQLQTWMEPTEAKDICLTYWLATCFKDSSSEITKLVLDEVNEILKENER